MTPARLAHLIAAVLVLGVSVLVASVRYPDEEAGLTVERADAINALARAGEGGSFVPASSCGDEGCVAAHMHNFPARARLLGFSIIAATLLVGLAFQRRYDRFAGPPRDG